MPNIIWQATLSEEEWQALTQEIIEQMREELQAFWDNLIPYYLPEGAK